MKTFLQKYRFNFHLNYMKRSLPYLIFVSFLGLSFLQPTWELKKNKDGIKVYTAKKEGSKYKQCKAEVSLKTDINATCNYFLNPSNYKDHSEKITKLEVVKQTDKQAIYYIAVDMPWPVSDRDGVYQVDVISKTNEKAILTITPLPDIIAKVKNHVRITVSSTKYIIKKNGDKVDIAFYQHVEPGGSVPALIANYFVEDSPYEVLTAVREDLEK